MSASGGTRPRAPSLRAPPSIAGTEISASSLPSARKGSSRPASVQSRRTAFQPCAATASIFLFAQGRSVICLHHDTLAVERRFEKHKADVAMLAVDNVSERGAGRLVVSYDEDMTAIVWDLFTGDEITRFASFEPLSVASWLRNGNVAFGNSQGHIMLFEPSTSEHKSARTIFDPITAIAPAADCQTYAIGYQNGSILIASILPSFTILHTLSTSGAPSPIVSLAWHASNSKQKSDMLAVQSGNGDLRVWSISKPPGGEAPKVIRVLKRGDAVEEGLSWIAWSKNGRIVQYSQSETWAWDVRTKHVAYEPVPTIDGVAGIANYGAGAVLFTLGPSNTVQQYDLNPPALVKNVRHDPAPSAQSTPKMKAQIPGAAPPIPAYKSIDPPRNGPQPLSTIQRMTSNMDSISHAAQLRNGMASPVSTTSRTESVDSRSSTGRHGYGNRSISSRAASGTTFSTLSPSAYGRESTASGLWPATASVASSGRRSKSSRLRNEILNSPEGNIVDLFPYTRARLASLPYAPQAAAIDPKTAEPSELRKQMLEIVFGWDGDIEPMIRDEMNKHPAGSMNATLLSKWLGEVNVDMMSMVNSDSVSQNDWMLLALSSMGGQTAAGQQMGRAFAQRLISQGDIHTAATIYIGIKDFDDAIDIYVSRNYFMEGILLTALLFPQEWQRQAALVRRWGEYVVENSQQHLAIRCFTVTGTDTSIPWASPTASPFQGVNPTIQKNGLPDTLSPPTSPPPDQRQGRMTAKNSSLKLITTFGAKDSGIRTLQLKTDDRTPTNAPGITPIADSALSPGGTPSTFLRPSRSKTPAMNRNRLPSIGETPIDVNPPQFPIILPLKPKEKKQDPSASTDGSGSEVEKESGLPLEQDQEPPKMIEDPPLTLSSARYDPKEEATPHVTPQTAIPNSAVRKSIFELRSEASAAERAGERSRTRNGSRDRKPTGLHIQMPSLSQLNLNAVATAGADKSPAPKNHHQHRRSNTASSLHSSESGHSGKFPDSVRGFEMLSPPGTGQSWASSAKSPSVSGRSIDPYISSLEEARLEAKQKKHRSRQARSRSKGRHQSQSQSQSQIQTYSHNQRQPSEDRGRSGQRYIRPAKRSPSSPVPMSPEDLAQYREAHSQSIDSLAASSRRDSSPEMGPVEGRRKGASKVRASSKFSEQSIRTTVRRHSPESHRGGEARSRHGSRMRDVNELLSPIDGRGRSQNRQGGGSVVRSPSSPLPMSPQAALYRYEADEVEDNDPLRLVEANRNRMRSRQRSSSRKAHERGVSSRREPSTDRRRAPSVDTGGRRRGASVDRRIPEPIAVPHGSYHQPQESLSRRDSPKHSDVEKAGSDSQVIKPRLPRSIKQELAARELELRRESLTAKTLAAVAHPESLHGRPKLGRSQSDIAGGWHSSGPSPSEFRSPDSFSTFSNNPWSHDMASGEFSPPERTASAGPLSIGLPATPRAMRHPYHGSRNGSISEQGREQHLDIPKVPELPSNPDAFYATGQPKFEISRSMSVPLPEGAPKNAHANNANQTEIIGLAGSPPQDMPTHPAFHRNVRPSTKRPGLAPLNEIGRQSARRPSIESNMSGSAAGSPPIITSPPILASINEAVMVNGHDAAVIDVPIVDVPLSANTPPAVIPELAHLVGGPVLSRRGSSENDNIPPPPPPPPMMPFATAGNGAEHHSLSSGSGVGTINIAMDSDGEQTQQQQQQSHSVPPTPPTKDTPYIASLPTFPSVVGGKPSPPLGGSGKSPLNSPPIASPPIPSSNGNGNGNGVHGREMHSGAGNGHRRGRSIDHIGKSIARIGERMRSSSRGRQAQGMAGLKREIGAPTPQPPPQGPSPYETRVDGGSYF